MNQGSSGRKPINAGDDTSIFNAQSNGNNGGGGYGGSSGNGGTTQRSPLNSGAIHPNSRYEASSSGGPNRTYTPPQHNNTTNANTNNNNATARTNPRQQQPQQPQQHQSRAVNNSNQNSSSNTPRQLSPTRSNQNVPEGYRIAKRELWWKEPAPSQHKILTGDKPKVDHVTAKVDHRNNDYSPHRQNSSTKLIESRRLEWNANHAVDTWGNFKHEPQGGNRRYPSENLQWNALPKVDSGFIYTFE